MKRISDAQAELGYEARRPGLEEFKELRERLAAEIEAGKTGVCGIKKLGSFPAQNAPRGSAPPILR